MIESGYESGYLSMQEDSRIVRTQYAIIFYFWLQGLILGDFAAVIPVLKTLHEINDVQLGYILLAAVGGAILSLPIVTISHSYLGAGASVTAGTVVEHPSQINSH